MKRKTLGAVLVFALPLLFAAGASAEEGAAVGLLPFTGSQAAQIRQRVQNRLRAEEVDLIPLKEVSAVARTTNGWAPRARKLGASLLVRARIQKSGEKWIADVEVRNADAQRVKKFRTSSTTSNKVANRIAAQLLDSGLLPLVSDAAADAESLAVSEDTPPTPTTAVAPSPEPSEALPPSLVVRPFTGKNASRVRTSVVKALLEEGVELTPTKEFSAMAKSMDADLSSEQGHVAPAKALGVVGLVEGEVSYEDGLWSAYIRLIDGQSAKVIDQHFYDADTSGGLARVVREEVYPDFKRDVRKLKSAAAAPAAVSVAPEAPDVLAQQTSTVERLPAEDAPRKKKRARPAAVDIQLDFRLEHRTFEYNDLLPDDPRGELRDYKLKLGPGIGTKLQWYPGAHFTSGVGAQFGIDFEYKRLFDFDSVRENPGGDDLKFPTSSQEFDVGVRWRYPTKRWEPFLGTGYGVHSFDIGLPADSPENTPEFPSVKYRYVRFAGGVRVKAASFLAITGSIAYRWVLDAGGIEDDVWFPNADTSGMDANLLFGFLLPKGFEIRLGGEYRRYWFDLNTKPDDEPPPVYVAGGALDQYWTGTLGVAWRH